MLKKGSIIVTLGIFLAAVNLLMAQPAPAVEDAPDRAPVDADNPLGFLFFDPVTGALAGASANNPALAGLDTPEARKERWLAAFAAQDPVGYVKDYPPLQEDLLAAQESLFQMMHPDDFVKFWDAQKSPDELQAEQNSAFAIGHPEEYNAQVLKDFEARQPPPEPPLPPPTELLPVDDAPLDSATPAPVKP